MTPERECITCGYPALRPDGHAPWCERVAAYLRALNPPPRTTPDQRAAKTAYQRAYRARKKAAAA